MYSSILVFAKKMDGSASTFLCLPLCHNIRTTSICLSSELWLLLINQSSTSNNNNYLNCQFHNLNNAFCRACKQKTHLKASVGNEGELQSLGGLLDPVSENKSADMSVCLFFVQKRMFIFIIQYISRMQLISERSWCVWRMGTFQGSSCQCDFKLLYCNTWNLGACVEHVDVF